MSGPIVILAVMMLILIFLGTVLDEIGIILLTVPVFIPVVKFLGFDEIWFGVLYAITIQMGYISPPFGYTLFYMKGALPPAALRMGVVYRGIVPFFLLQAVGACRSPWPSPGLMTILPRADGSLTPGVVPDRCGHSPGDSSLPFIPQ